MLAVVLSLLFGLAAFVALIVIRRAIATGASRARYLLAVLAEAEASAGIVRPTAPRRPAAARRLAAA